MNRVHGRAGGIEVRHLRLVRAIVEEGSVTRAGLRLDLTQSAVSCQLRELEKRLGTLLFRRVQHRLLLTEAGERVLASAAKVLEEVDRLEQEVGRERPDPKLPLRITTECYTCYHWLPPMLTRLRPRWPNLEIEIVIEATHEPDAALLDGRVDLAIMSTPEGRRKQIAFTPMFQDELLAVVSPSHALASKAFITPKDFAGEHLFMYDVAPEDSTVLQCILKPEGVVPRRVSRVQLTEAILEMVRAGLGLAVMARWAVAPLLESKALKGVRIGKSGFVREWGVATLKGRNVPAHVRDFARMLAKEGSLQSSPPLNRTQVWSEGIY